MHAVIFGSNPIGIAVAEAMAKAGESVVIVDETESNFARLSSDFTGFALSAPLTQALTWDRARLKQAEVTLVVTGDFTLRLMLAEVAKVHYRVPHVICLSEDGRQAELFGRLGITTVQGDQVVAAAILKQLE